MTDSRRYLFILTYPRTGSTLLTGILNTLPDVCIQGENYNALFELFRSCRAIREANQPMALKNSTLPFFRVEDFDHTGYTRELVSAARRFLFPPASEGSVVGFKEVRYARHEYLPTLREFLEFIEQHFAPAQFIVLKRNHIDVAISQLRNIRFERNASLKDMADRLNTFEAITSEFAASRTNVLQLSYEELKSGEPAVNRLLEFLGIKADPAAIVAEMKREYSYQGGAELPVSTRLKIQLLKCLKLCRSVLRK